MATRKTAQACIHQHQEAEGQSSIMLVGTTAKGKKPTKLKENKNKVQALHYFSA